MDAMNTTVVVLNNTEFSNVGIDNIILSTVLIILGVIGIGANIFSGIVWFSDLDIHSSGSTLLSTLACYDVTFLGARTLSIVCLLSSSAIKNSTSLHYFILMMDTVAKLALYGSGYLTVSATINRGIAIFRPFTFTAVCTQEKARKVVYYISCGCFILLIPDIVKYIFVRDTISHYWFICFVLESVFMFAVPWLFVFILNIIMFVKLLRYNSQCREEGPRSIKKHKKLLNGVVAVGIMSVVTYPVSFAFLVQQHHLYGVADVVNVFTLYGDVARFLNASMNLVLYMTLSDQFGKLLKEMVFCERYRWTVVQIHEQDLQLNQL